MSKRIIFHNDLHLGDCLYHTHYLQRLWRQSMVASTFYCDPAYHDELSPFIPVGADIRLGDIKDRPEDSINCWIGHEDWHKGHPNWHDYVRMYVDFFKHISNLAGVRCPIVQKTDMLFDSPEIMKRDIPPTRYDFLVINAKPLSEQFPHSTNNFLRVITDIRNSRRTVITTHPCGINNVPATINLGYKIIDISKLSSQVENILGIDTGPTGSTFTVWNQTTVKNRFILHKENFFTHEGCHAIHKWAALHPALARTRALVRTTS